MRPFAIGPQESAKVRPASKIFGLSPNRGPQANADILRSTDQKTKIDKSHLQNESHAVSVIFLSWICVQDCCWTNHHSEIQLYGN